MNSDPKKYSSELGLIPSRFSYFSAISERFSEGKERARALPPDKLPLRAR